MSFLMFLRTSLFFFSILAGAIASPCQRRRDTSSIDFFNSSEESLDDQSSTLAFATITDPNPLSYYADLDVSIFSNSPDGSSSAALDNGLVQTSDLDSTTGFALDGEPGGSSESLFPEIDSEGFSGEDLVAQLPNFGGITDFSFKDLENEQSCRADEAPSTQSGREEKVPGTTDETFEFDNSTPEDKRKCPSVNGKQTIALCCFSAFEKNDPIQHNCYRCT